jgi:RNA polymerase sigma-70 factor (ECF subfamily)
MAKEDTLIYRAQTGDEGAFADLMRAYHAFVYVIVIGIVDNSHDAEEVVQDAFLNAYQGLKQLEDATKFKGWLAEITRNCARQWLRKQRGETVPIDEVSEHLLQTEDSPDEQLVRQEQRELIRRTMETLPQKDRDIARAFYLEGASYDQLTSAHGLSYNAIAFRLFRIKRKLSKRLRYLLTGIFVSPGLTLKKIYSGGLTVMKVGTVPKITVGVAALVALIFIGFVGIRQMRAPTVEERVYLSPWEDGAAHRPNTPEESAAPTDSTQDTESWDNPSQIVVAESGEGIEPIDDVFSQLEERDTAQFETETEFQPDSEQSVIIDTSTLLDDEGRSAEDVMNAYLEASKNLDFKAMLPLLTGAAREDLESNLPTLEDTMAEITEAGPETKQFIEGMLSQILGRTEIVSSEYVGDEYHFQLREKRLTTRELMGMAMRSLPEEHQAELPDIPEVEIAKMEAEMEKIPEPPDIPIKMRKENGAWRIYEEGNAN